jgi:hypothetical protein
MKNDFNQQVSGVSPEQTRAALFLDEVEREPTVVEQEQLLPELKPDGIGEDIVDKHHFQSRLHEEYWRMAARQMYAEEMLANFHVNGLHVGSTFERQAVSLDDVRPMKDDFNISSSQEHDLNEIETSL